MTNWGYKAVRKVLQTFGGAELAQQQSGRITGEPGNPEVATLARRAGAESCVLLKNNNHALPLDLSAPVALFGRVQKNYFYVGNGSGGDVSAPYSINLVQGLVNAGVQLDSTVLAAYESWCTASVNDPDPGFWGHWPRYYAEMPVKQDWVQAAAKRCQTAVVVIGRSAGEDRENTLKKGSFYLTNKEKALLDAVTTAFQKVVLVLNIGSIMDFAEIDAYGDKISAILLAWQLGMESGNAVADVLTGQVNPSGRLTDTIAKTYADYPAQNFGNKAENRYTEDIFVGYRYFETFAPERVLYPFGYGLSYTDFACKVKKTEIKDQTVTVQVQVENTGALPGKQVVQLYACCPCGALGKAAKVLIAFGKTEELAPGKHQSLTLTAPYRHFASFDDSGAAGHKNAWLLEAGDYTFCIGTDVRSAVPCGDLHLADTLVLEQCCQLLAPPADSGFDRLTATEQNGKVTRTYAPVPTATVDLKQEILDHLRPAGHRQQGLCAGRCSRGQRQPGRLCSAAVYHGDGAAQSRRGHDGQPTGCLRQCGRHGRGQRQPAPKGHTPGDHHRRPLRDSPAGHLLPAAQRHRLGLQLEPAAGTGPVRRHGAGDGGQGHRCATGAGHEYPPQSAVRAQF